MFAGKMKLTTFLTAVVVGGTCAVGGFLTATYLLGGDTSPPVAAAPPPVPSAPAAPSAPLPAPEAPEAPAATAGATAAMTAPAGARDIDTVVLSYVGKDIGSDKLKDTTKGKPFKVNVYQDAGEATANRAKVDLDRDDKWDEKFTFEAGAVTREVAPADDEVYTEKYRWDGQGWAAGG